MIFQNEKGDLIPGDIQQLMVEILLTGAPTPAQTSILFVQGATGGMNADTKPEVSGLSSKF